MPNRCAFCEVTRPIGGTNHLVLNGGEIWIEFCPACGDKEELESDTGEVITVSALFARLGEEKVKAETEKWKRGIRMVECPSCGWSYGGGPGAGGMPAERCPACSAVLVIWEERP